MLRALVLALLVANAVFWGWSHGAPGALGWAPVRPDEPERLARQVHAQALHLAPAPGDAAPAPARAASTPDTAPQAAAALTGGVCLQAGPFDERQAGVLRSAAQALPAGHWRLDGTALPGRWMVYIGKLADADAVRAKRAELRELGVDTDRPGAALEPGISLGRFASEDAATRALTELGRKGVRSARVVPERRDTPAFVLRLPQADAALRAQVLALGPALAGRDLRACD
ncbi:MAG: SPOR domain-containing protein [Proteobacteria bacterium]|nr:SPOR domain-containing protein [Pseudomonadota bacterium]